MDVMLAHRALSDPGRLALAQALLSRDLSGAETADLFNWSSPLAAHHVNTLVEGGIAVRQRSEHDARRAYVSLRHDDIDVVTMVSIGLPPGNVPARVAFVCTRNSARSKLAAAWWRQLSDVPAVDAGTAPAEAPARGTLAVAERFGLDIDPVMRHVDDALEPGDLVIAVCDHVHETLPADAARLHWSVPDPVSSPEPAAFAAASDEVRQRIGQLHQRLTRQPRASRCTTHRER